MNDLFDYLVDLFFQDGSLTFFGCLLVSIPLSLVAVFLTKIMFDFVLSFYKYDTNTEDSDVVIESISEVVDLDERDCIESTSKVVDLEEREYTKKLPKYNRK